MYFNAKPREITGKTPIALSGNLYREENIGRLFQYEAAPAWSFMPLHCFTKEKKKKEKSGLSLNVDMHIHGHTHTCSQSYGKPIAGNKNTSTYFSATKALNL